MAEMFKVTFQNVSNKLLNCGNIKKNKKKKMITTGCSL